MQTDIFTVIGDGNALEEMTLQFPDFILGANVITNTLADGFPSSD